MILSIDAEKALDKIEHHFLTKPLKNIGIEGTHLNIMKAIYERPTDSLINWKNRELSPRKVRNTAGMFTLSTAVQHNTVSPSLSNQTTKRNKEHTNWQGRSRTFTLNR